MKSLDETLKDQNGTLTEKQISQFFRCGMFHCSQWNFGAPYKCDIGKCKEEEEARQRYLPADSNKK